MFENNREDLLSELGLVNDVERAAWVSPGEHLLELVILLFSVSSKQRLR